MTRTIVFLHGAWVTPASWAPFESFFESRGYETVAPAWPGKDRPIEAIRADPSPLAGLGIAEIVDHYEQTIRALPEPPILIGHSFGGLFVQILLDRGLGSAGVAIDSAPPKGIFSFELSAYRSLASVLLTWRGWRKVVTWSFGEFRYAFVNGLAPEVQRAAYDEHVTPESGRVFFQQALANFSPGSPLHVNFANDRRAPLLLIGGGSDHIAPAAINRRNVRKYSRSKAVTDYREFPGRTHWTIAQEGWDEVASHIEDWLAAQR